MPEGAFTEDQEWSAGALDVDAQLAEDISALVDAGQRGMVLNLVADLYPADLARLLEHLPFEKAHLLFHWLPVEQAGDVLAELEGGLRTGLLEEIHTERLTELIDELDSDDAADLLAELPAEVAQQVLPGLEDAEDVRELLSYGEETAGGIMGTEYVAVRPEITVAEATEEVRKNAETIEHIYALYVVDEVERLRGIVPLQRLLLARARSRIGDIMETDVHAVTAEVDQEEVARIMERYDLVSLPVIDTEGHLLGRITIDDVVDVIRDEAEEDIQIMSGISTGDEEPSDSVFRISRGRLPWLLIGLVGASLSGTVISGFQEGLQQAVWLAIFIPIVTAMGGNAAVQSAAIAVQGLISGDFWTGELMRRIGKEFTVAIVNGVILSVLIGSLVFILGNVVSLGGHANAFRLALTVGLTMLSVIIVATTNGAFMPFLLRHLGADPASAMGPFVTTLNDIIGLTIYFLIAKLIYL